MNTDEETKPDKVPDEELNEESIIVALAIGGRHPRNEYESNILAEIKEIEAKGYMLDMPLF